MNEKGVKQKIKKPADRKNVWALREKLNQDYHKAELGMKML